MEVFQKIIELKIVEHGELHKVIGDTYYSMAALLKQLGGGARAVELYLKAADMYEQSYGWDRKETLDAKTRGNAVTVWLYDIKPKSGDKIDGNPQDSISFYMLAECVGANPIEEL